VGALTDRLHVIDARTLEVLWKKPGRFYRTFCRTEDIAVTWSLSGEGVACHELRSGRVLWERPESELGGSSELGCIWEGRFIHCMGAQLTALDLGTGQTLWRWKLPGGLHWWHPYDGRGYVFIHPGRYIIVDLATGEQLFEKSLGPHVPVPLTKRKDGLRVVSGTRLAPSWQYVRLSVSETHAFVVNASGQILVLVRDTGELEQVLELDGMPMMMEPIIYRNHLLISDFNASIYCFKGAE
jgi:outer membrane protein assembly factor BamB